MSITLVIPDLHCPFEHQDAFNFVEHVAERFCPDNYVCLGDEADMHAFSRYARDPVAYSPHHEIIETVKHLQPFYKAFPDMMVCESNHTMRPWIKAGQNEIPESILMDYQTVLQSPDGWEWRDEWILEGVKYIHGDVGASGAYAHVNLAKAAACSVVIGHMHCHAGVNRVGPNFAMNTGCLIDTKKYAFKYAKKSNLITPVSLGCGIVVDGDTAHFIRMRTHDTGRKKGRWIGKL